nr:portal protein [Myxococcota bacterium]
MSAGPIAIAEGQAPVGAIQLAAPLGWPDDLRGLRAGLDERIAILRQDRQGYEPHWHSLARLFRPRWPNWLDRDQAQRGEAQDNDIVHSGPMLATRVLRGGMFIGLTPPTREYHRIVPIDRKLARNWKVQTYTRDVDRILREERARTNAYATYANMFGDESVWGNGAMAYYPDASDAYATIHYPVGSFWLSVDSKGRPNELWLGQRVRSSQLADRFGKERLPERVKMDIEQGHSRTEWTLLCVIHATPTGDRNPWNPGLPWRAVWFLEEIEADKADRHGILDIQGYHEQPWMAPRWATSGTDAYAVESPAMLGRGDAASLQHLMKSLSLAIDRIADPPMIADTEFENGGRRLSLRAGAITYGGFANGKPPISSVYDSTAGLRVAELVQLMDQLDARVKQACFADVFYMFAMSRDDQG